MTARLPLLILGALACGAPAPGPRVSPASASPDQRLAAAESSYLATRDLRDRLDVAVAGGRRSIADGTTLASLLPRYDSLRRGLQERLAVVDSSALTTDDNRALDLMRRTLGRDLGPLVLPGPAAAGGSGTAGEPAPDCAYDPAALSRAPGGRDSLRARMYACYGWAQSHVADGDTTLDRLTAWARWGIPTTRRAAECCSCGSRPSGEA